MSRRARTFLGLLIATSLVLVAGIPGAARADIAAPVVIAAPDSDGIANAPSSPACAPRVPGNLFWATCLLPERDAVVDWPTGLLDIWPAPRSFILPKPGLFAIWLGETRSNAGRPLIWYDVGSGFPVSPASGPYGFPNAGKYAWECLTCSGVERQKLQGTMYVVGPRAIVKTKLVSPDNSGSSVTYGFDASGSFVTDFAPHQITQYAFDFEDDGTYDQVSPEPTAQASLSPGPHTVRVRVTDDLGRTGEWPEFVEVPYVRPGNPEPNPQVDTGPSSLNPTGVKFATAKVRIKAVKRIRITVLRKRGLSVKVTGLTKGDRVRARLLKGKKSVVASGAATAAKSTRTVRLRVGSAGRRILRSIPRPSRLVLDVAVEGTDGFSVTKRAAVRLR